MQKIGNIMNVVNEECTAIEGETTEWEGLTRNRIPWKVFAGDAATVLKRLPRNEYSCVVTSPPYYWLRDYEVNGQIGKEETVSQYISAIVAVMDEVRQTLREDGVLFLNLGDTYYSAKGLPQGPDPKSRKRRLGLRAVDKSGGLGIGLRPKTIIGIPWRVAIAMSEKGWVLRSPIIWYRKYSLPEKVIDRPRRSYEHIFMFVKNRKYYFNRQALIDVDQEDMWTIVARPEPINGLSTAPYPDELVQRCLDLGCPPGGSVMDPFAGAGTTLRVALRSGRPVTGIDLNHKFCQYMVEQLERL